MKNPPNEPNQLRIENMMISTPHVVWLAGLLFSMTALTIMSIPHRTPTRPKTPPIPPMKNVKIAPMAATTNPVKMTIIPAMSVSTKAAVGF